MERRRHRDRSLLEYRALKSARAFQDLIALGGRGARVVNRDGTSELHTVNVVTPNFFSVLGVRAETGRVFSPADDSSVRSRAHELRRKLQKYYGEEDPQAAVRLRNCASQGYVVCQNQRATRASQRACDLVITVSIAGNAQRAATVRERLAQVFHDAP